MKRFKNILLVHGDHVGGDEALSRAAGLAASNAARLTIMNALEDTDATRMVMEESEKRLSRLLASVQHEVPETAAAVTSGIPFIDITRQVLRDGHDLVVMTADSVQGLRHLVFGSTSMHLMRKCPCPIWVLKPNQLQPYRNILAAVARPANDMERDELNIKILDFATSLALTERGELHIFHAWDFAGTDADAMRSETTQAQRDRLHQKYESERTKWLNDLLAGYDLRGIRYRAHLVRGRPESAITQAAKETEADLIVMGTVCRTGIPGFLIGNTAESVLNQVDCSVLTIKPAGFVTPITIESGA